MLTLQGTDLEVACSEEAVGLHSDEVVVVLLGRGAHREGVGLGEGGLHMDLLL
jgi:hypothetical protein